MGCHFIVLGAPVILLLSSIGPDASKPAAVTVVNSFCWAMCFFDLQLFLRTSQHMHNFWMPFTEMWSMTHGIRLALVEALAIAAVLGYLAAKGVDRLLSRLLDKWPTVQAKQLTKRQYTITNISLFGLATIWLLLFKRMSDLSCFKPELRTYRIAWDSLPYHLSSSECVSVAAMNDAQNDAALVGLSAEMDLFAHHRPVDTDDMLLKDDDSFITSRIKNKKNIILFLIDSLPGREFVDGVPDEARRTSGKFRETVTEDMVGHKKCTLLPHHFAGSSYSDPGFYTLFHSILPLELNDKKFNWCMPLDLLKLAGYQTSIFLNGPIGYDICEARHLADGAGTRRFEEIQIYPDDEGVTTGALDWIASRKNNSTNSNPFFMVVYYQGVHLLYARRFAGIQRFEKAFYKILDDADLIIEKAHHFEPLVLFTTDHGCARPGPDSDCPSCRGHGFQILDDHATESISHIPFWICSPAGDSSGSIRQLTDNALSLNITSAMDVMPSLLDLVQLEPMPPLNLWSNGRSWIRTDSIAALQDSADIHDYSFVFSVSRLNCVLRLAMITLRTVFYHFSKMNCLFPSSASHSSSTSGGSGASRASCTTTGKTFDFPLWNGAEQEPKRLEWYNTTYRNQVMLHRVLEPIKNRNSLPFPPAPNAFLLKTSSTGSKPQCLAVNDRNTVGVVDCPTIFPIPNNFTLQFLWDIGPDGDLFQVSSRGRLREKVQPFNLDSDTVLTDIEALNAGHTKILSLCQAGAAAGNDFSPVLKFSRKSNKTCQHLTIQRPWLDLNPINFQY